MSASEGTDDGGANSEAALGNTGHLNIEKEKLNFELN